MRRPRLQGVYRKLTQAYGTQQWWPADSPFEVMVGAILTQNTAWINVQQAIDNLKTEHHLDAQAIADAHPARLARLLRPSGYFNVKSKRLRNFCRWYLRAGGEPALRRVETDQLRRSLLAVNGIGPETADDILLYAFERPVFVIDAYTRRILARIGLIDGEERYDVLRLEIESALGADAVLFNEYHALLVRHGKDVCRKNRPRCTECCLAACCAGRTLTSM